MLENEVLLQEFAEEAKTHSEKIESGLLCMEKGEQTYEVINEVFRSAHSIKGTAGFFGLTKIVELSHAMENLLGKLRSKTIGISQVLIDGLLAANDALRELLLHVPDSNQMDITLPLKKLSEVEAPVNAAATKQAPIKDNAPPEAGEKTPQTESLQVNTDYQALFKELIKKGHKMYQMTWQLKANDGQEEKAFLAMADSIRSIGRLLLIKRLEESDQGAVAGEESVLFVFSTILDKELVLIALSIKETEVKELDIRKQDAVVIEKLKQLVSGASLLPAISGTGLPAAGMLQEHAEKLTKGEERIRVDVGVLNILVNLSGELVLARNQLLRLLADHADSIQGLSQVLQKIDQTTTFMQENIMLTRMQPIAHLFNAVPRMVRELAKTLGKNVELSLEGQEVELDRSIIEGLKDPFAHLLRNALDHGIESPKERVQKGKSPSAMLKVKASNQFGRVILEITDDGRGIDVTSIRQKAMEKGLLAMEQGLSEQELIQLIFLPGFSTNQEISAVSGRGVGLDVVKSNVERMGGTVEVKTVLNQGTTFRLLLPLTLAIIPSLLVESAGHRFALPQANLVEIVRLVKHGLHKLEVIQGQCVLRLRNSLVPVIDLANAIGLKAGTKRDIARVLILKNGKCRFGLLVDQITDREDILVKPIPLYLKAKKVYSGVTILGDGKISMVLDAEGIASQLPALEADHKPQPKVPLLEPQVTKEQQILLFELFGPETFGLELSQVARVEEFYQNQVELVGGREYYYFQGNILSLIRLQDHLPLGPREAARQKSYLLIPKNQEARVCFVVSKIKDTITAGLSFVPSSYHFEGLAGSLMVKNRVVLLLDMKKLLAMQKPGDNIRQAGSVKDEG